MNSPSPGRLLSAGMALMACVSAQTDVIFRTQTGPVNGQGTAAVDVRGDPGRNSFTVNIESNGQLRRVLNIDTEGRVFITMGRKDSGTRFVMQDQSSGQLLTSGAPASVDADWLGDGTDALIVQGTDSAGKATGTVARLSKSALRTWVANQSGESASRLFDEALNVSDAERARLATVYGLYDPSLMASAPAPVVLDGSVVTVTPGSGKTAEGEMTLNFAVDLKDAQGQPYCPDLALPVQGELGLRLMQVSGSTRSEVARTSARALGVNHDEPMQISATLPMRPASGAARYEAELTYFFNHSSDGPCEEAPLRRVSGRLAGLIH